MMRRQSPRSARRQRSPGRADDNRVCDGLREKAVFILDVMLMFGRSPEEVGVSN